MSEYKDTLNLPTTAFPMKANLAQREPERLKKWEAQGIYQKIRTQRAGSKKFILHDGPPYANGHLHCGHALNKILKDIVVKSKTLSGYDAPFVPGWDCHGLPVELNVEKKLKKTDKLTTKEFREQCRLYASSQVEIQKEEFKRLGVFGDWENPYTTMNYKYEANIVRALGKIIENDHLSQGFKPVHWCVDCGSALAEAEVEYEDKTSPSIDVAFIAQNPQEFLNEFAQNLPNKPVIVPIWTTTPWTLPANEAVCLHPELFYSLVETAENYYFIAADLVTSVTQRYKIQDFRVHGPKVGSVFDRFALKHPFLDKVSPIALGEHVTVESGTGCVHTASAHGPDDFLIGQKYGFPLMNPVKNNGCFADNVPFFAGLNVFKANPKILEVLVNNKTLLHQETISHSYPHCWRHKTPIIFRATPQWFISMDKNDLRGQLLQHINEVKWIPNWGEARIKLMVENRPDWCVSRQRTWNTPITLFVHKDSRELHPNTLEFIEDIAQKIEQNGIDAWFELDIKEFLKKDADFYEKITDTLDVWFDSGVSHYCVLQQDDRLQYPADLYLEGSDQHRGWFNSSLTTAVAMYGTPPYKTVLTHGYTVDGEGKKLSKSQGNYVALDKLINQHGADILRLWVSSTDYRNEVSISEEIIKRNADAYRRIRNTARFLLANLFDFDPQQHCLHDGLLELDRWAIKRCQLLQEDIVKAYEQYNFHVIYQKLHNFCAIDMGSFYLDVIKDRQYTTPVNSKARRSCQTAMYHIINAFTRWLAPILSFTADEIWEMLPGDKNESVFLNEWYVNWPQMVEVDIEKWDLLQSIRDEVNKSLEIYRREGIIGSGLEAEVTLYADGKIFAALSSLKEELKFLFITSNAVVYSLSDYNGSKENINESGIVIEIRASSYTKCSRCWHRVVDVGTNTEHPELCTRCVGNIQLTEEKRRFA